MKKYILKKNKIKVLFINLLLIFALFTLSCQKNKISKLDKGKEIVYDADYLENVDFYKTNAFDNCKIPYINIDSNGAREINNEILEYTKDIIIKDYKDGKKEGITYEPMAYYKYEMTEDYISIKFEYNIELYKYPDNIRTYILDLESGEKLSLDKAIEIATIDKDFLGLVEGKIIDFYDEMLEDYQEIYEDANFSNFQAYTLANFWQDYYEENLNFYLNSEKEMSLLLNFQVPTGAGFIQEELEIKEKDLPMEEEINPIYEYLAKENYELYEGGVAFLGYNSLDTMETIASKVETIISKFGDQARFPLSYFHYEIDDGSYFLNGDEFYLLCAKYKNAVIKIYYPRYDENNEMKFDDEAVNIYGSNCISFCNLSDIRPNTKVEYIYRDKIIEFKPSVSLMDSSKIKEIDGLIDLGYAYGELEESKVNFESTNNLSYMRRIFIREDFID